MFDDLAADRQAQAGALRAVGGVAALAELLEDQRCAGRRHAGAVVLHLHRQPPRVHAQAHRRPAPAALAARTWPRWTAGSAPPAAAGRGRRAAWAPRVSGRCHLTRRRARATARAVVCTACASSPRRSTSALCQSAWPDSILAMSSTWLTRRDRRSVSATTMPRNCWRCAAVHVGSSTHQLGQRADAESAACAARASRWT
jgi:hypothetical protein